MDYICLNACTMGGNEYMVGDTVPEKVVMPQRVNALVSMGLIALGNTENTIATGTLETAEEQTENMIPVTLLGKEGEPDTAVYITAEDAAKIFIALQYNAENAAEFVRENIDSLEALEVLARLDQRKAVKNAIAEKTASEE